MLECLFSTDTSILSFFWYFPGIEATGKFNFTIKNIWCQKEVFISGHWDLTGQFPLPRKLSAFFLVTFRIFHPEGAGKLSPQGVSFIRFHCPSMFVLTPSTQSLSWKVRMQLVNFGLVKYNYSVFYPERITISLCVNFGVFLVSLSYTFIDILIRIF